MDDFKIFICFNKLGVIFLLQVSLGNKTLNFRNGEEKKSGLNQLLHFEAQNFHHFL